MSTLIQTEVQADATTLEVLEAAEVTLRTLEGAEMIQIGGGYCAADY
ncbi:MAG: hypothetical protein ABSF50_11030 [Burkholderiaceae bacterium]|jgi:hypothetical protein